MNHQTEWPFATDAAYGNPIELCFCCGHEKQRHYPWGAKDGKAFRCCPCKTFI